MHPSTEKHLQDAKAALAAGDVRAAYSQLRWVLEYPSPILKDDALWAEVVPLFADVCRGIAGAELEAKVRAVVGAPAKKKLFGFGKPSEGAKAEPQALYDLGFALIDQKLDGIAATFLHRAHELLPGHEGVLTELVTALEGAGHHGEARRILEAAPAELMARSFMCSYLLAFDTLLTTDVRLARERQTALQPKDDTHAWMKGAIGVMLDRAEALLVARTDETLNTSDLRGWHFVINGTILLHRSPFGFGEGMLGRYAFTQDSHWRCKLGLERLAIVCKRTGYLPAAILAMPDKDSRVLAYAAHHILKAPLKEWSDDPTQPGLIVAYDMQHVEVSEQAMRTLHQHSPGQGFYEHAGCWTAPFPIASDVVNYLHQFNETPWGERMQFDADTREPKKAPADARSPDAIAVDVLDAKDPKDEEVPLELQDVERLADLVQTLPEHVRPAMLRRDGRRFRARPDSPVKSSRFA